MVDTRVYACIGCTRLYEDVERHPDNMCDMCKKYRNNPRPQLVDEDAISDCFSDFFNLSLIFAEVMNKCVADYEVELNKSGWNWDHIERLRTWGLNRSFFNQYGKQLGALESQAFAKQRMDQKSRG